MHLTDHYATTLPDFFTRRLPARTFPQARLLVLNTTLARDLNLDPTWLQGPEGVAMLAGGQRPDGVAPVAMAYAGHQFGHFNPTMGDGRAMLVGELTDTTSTLRDLHLKGSGPTPFARRGDGWSALGPALREFIVAEAMAHLGIPTTRALAVVATGQTVMREQPQPGAVLARVARAHLRIGTFEHARHSGTTEDLRALADYAIDRLYPHLREDASPYAGLLDAVVHAQARLVAHWMQVGFVHGVMNTDNTAISGETLDYGPCAFLDAYHPGQVFSSIDQYGRYAFGQQPDIALWNLTRLAQSMLPILASTPSEAIATAQTILERFAPAFGTAHLAGWRLKLGFTTDQPEDAALISTLLRLMHDEAYDFTNTLRRLCDAVEHDAIFADQPALTGWLTTWRARLAQAPMPPEARSVAMKAANPRIIPRNHRIEAALTAAYHGDLGPMDQLRRALSAPYAESDDNFATPPTREEQVFETFCGT